MLTGWPSATGSAAPPAVKSQPGRAATGKQHGDRRSPWYFRLVQLAAAALAEFTTASPPEALGGHALAVE
eukprot:136260-Prymnesium_polylepis.1